VLVRDTRTNDVKQVYRTKRGFLISGRRRDVGDRFSRREVHAVRKAMQRRKRQYAVFVTRSRYPFLVLDSDTKMVRAPLAHRLNELARRTQRYMWIGEGWRTHARQWELWRQYEARGFAPPTVAYPGTSNHEGGNAADASFLLSGRGGSYVNLGNYQRSVTVRRMKDLGLALVVGGEPWHVEIGTAWRA
jgi:hypothetical protein